jgi:hypothetical protein
MSTEMVAIVAILAAVLVALLMGWSEIRLAERELKTEARERIIAGKMLSLTDRCLCAAESACVYHERERQKRDIENKKLRHTVAKLRWRINPVRPELGGVIRDSWSTYLLRERKIRQKARAS